MRGTFPNRTSCLGQKAAWGCTGAEQTLRLPPLALSLGLPGHRRCSSGLVCRSPLHSDRGSHTSFRPHGQSGGSQGSLGSLPALPHPGSCSPHRPPQQPAGFRHSPSLWTAAPWRTRSRNRRQTHQRIFSHQGAVFKAASHTTLKGARCIRVDPQALGKSPRWGLQVRAGPHPSQYTARI